MSSLLPKVLVGVGWAPLSGVVHYATLSDIFCTFVFLFCALHIENVVSRKSCTQDLLGGREEKCHTNHISVLCVSFMQYAQTCTQTQTRPNRSTLYFSHYDLEHALKGAVCAHTSDSTGFDHLKHLCLFFMAESILTSRQQCLYADAGTWTN